MNVDFGKVQYRIKNKRLSKLSKSIRRLLRISNYDRLNPEEAAILYVFLIFEKRLHSPFQNIKNMLNLKFDIVNFQVKKVVR